MKMKSFNEWSELKESFFTREPHPQFGTHGSGKSVVQYRDIAAKNLSNLGNQLRKLSEQMPEVYINYDQNKDKPEVQYVSKQLRMVADEFEKTGHIKEFLNNLSDVLHHMGERIEVHTER